MKQQTVRTHRQDWVITQTISKVDLSTGHLIGFLYGSDKLKNRDKLPFVLFLGIDRQKDLLHGLALNYLTRYQIRELFTKFNIT